MLTVFFGITTLVCGIGWFITWHGFQMMLVCWKERNIDPPSDAELEKAKQILLKRWKR